MDRKSPRATNSLTYVPACMNCSMCSVLCVVEVSSGNVLRQPQDL